MRMIFLPFSNFKKSAAALDDVRLQHQRRIAKQMIDFLTTGIDKSKRRLAFHPTIKMWKGYVPALKLHHDILIDEWVSRGKKNTMKKYYKTPKKLSKKQLPWWLGREKFHRSHRSVLFSKFPEFYRSMFPKQDKGYNKSYYWWPMMKTKTFEIIIPLKDRAALRKHKPVAKKSIKPVSKKVKVVTNKVIKPVAKKTIKPVAKKVIKPIVKKVKTTMNKITMPVAQKIVQKAVRRFTKDSVTNKYREVVSKKTIKPLTKKVTKPIVKKTPKVVAKKVSKPVAKKVKVTTNKKSKPITKKATKPTKKSGK